MSAVSYERQSQILDPDKAADTHITVLGAGTVGSWAAYCLAKAGFKNFWICDMDTVEDVNLPSQVYDVSDIGSTKVAALEERLKAIAPDINVSTRDWALDGFEQYNNGVIIAAVDDMEMRKAIFENGCAHKPAGTSLFADFRMGGNLLKVWSFDPSDDRRAAQYRDTLHSTEDAAPLPCGGRTFSPVGPLSGSIATQIVTKWLRNNDHPPFHIQMDFDRFQSTPIGLPKTED